MRQMRKLKAMIEQQPEGQEHDQAFVVAAAEDQVGEPAAEGQDRQHRRHGQRGAEPGRAAEETPQLARLPVAIDIPPERARQRHHQQRPGQHEEAEGHVPLAELFRAEPAAEADLPREADRALQHGRCQQQHDAQGQGVAVQRRRRVDRRLAVHGDRVGSCGGFVHIATLGQKRGNASSAGRTVVITAKCAALGFPSLRAHVKPTCKPERTRSAARMAIVIGAAFRQHVAFVNMRRERRPRCCFPATSGLQQMLAGGLSARLKPLSAFNFAIAGRPRTSPPQTLA